MFMHSCLPEPVFAIHTTTYDLMENEIVLSSGFLQQIKGEKQKELILAIKHLNLEELIFHDAEDAQLLVLDSYLGDQVWLVKTSAKKKPYFIIMLSSEI